MVSWKMPTFQSSETTVRDWKTAAHDIASKLISDQQQTGSTIGAPKPFFVQVLGPQPIFLREVADELEAEILRRGGAISPGPNHATVVTLAVDVVPWSGRSFFPVKDTEAVLKAAAVANGQLVMKLVEPVYVRRGDVALYQPPAAEAPTRLLRYEH